MHYDVVDDVKKTERAQASIILSATPAIPRPPSTAPPDDANTDTLTAQLAEAAPIWRELASKPAEPAHSMESIVSTLSRMHGQSASLAARIDN